jgi:hypothetical protein
MDRILVLHIFGVQEYAPILYQIWKKKHKKLSTNGVLMRHTSK